ncbi:hypothetical protein HDU83_000003 [Entophlyctis luteolus]|nr:hypothetical protein HDU82_007453 [Entophlyctis luteolus]KAJ3357946.1 hypothetical protein HDU83_000003 [Entophlyctis luteolus]
MPESATFEDEVQLMPGVYLSRLIPRTSHPTSSPEASGAQPGEQQSLKILTADGITVDTSDAFGSDDADIIQREIARLRLSAQKLLESNAMLKEFQATDSDPEISLAISENVVIIDRQLRAIKALTLRLATLPNVAGVSAGPCQAELAANSTFVDASSNPVLQAAAIAGEGEESIAAVEPLRESMSFEPDESGGLYL